MKLVERWLYQLNQAFWACLPSCQETIYFISLDLDRHLPWPKRVLVRIHYQFCIYTRRYAGQLRGMQRFLRALDKGNYRLLDQQSLPAERKAALAAKLRAVVAADSAR